MASLLGEHWPSGVSGGRRGLGRTPRGGWFARLRSIEARLGRAGLAAALVFASLTVLMTAQLAAAPASRAELAFSCGSSQGYAYVVNSQSGSVQAIYTGTNSVVANIPTGGSPYGVAATQNGQFLYVADGSGKVEVINTATFAVTTITDPSFAAPVGAWVSPDNSQVFVTNYNANTVSVISTATNTVTRVITLGATGGSPGSVDAVGNLLYIARDRPTLSDNQTSPVAVVDMNSTTATGPTQILTGTFSAHSIAVNGSYLVTAHQQQILHFDTIAGVPLATNSTVTIPNGLGFVHGLAFVPGTNYVLATTTGAPANGNVASVLVYDASTGTLVRQFAAGGTDMRISIPSVFGDTVYIPGATSANGQTGGEFDTLNTTGGPASWTYTQNVGALAGLPDQHSPGFSCMPPLTGAKAFAKSPIQVGEVTRLTFTITNPNITPNPLTGVTLSDTLPSNIQVAPTPNTATTCGSGTVTAAGSTVSLAGGTIAPATYTAPVKTNGTCTVGVNVVGVAAGTQTNTVPAGGLSANIVGPSTTPFSASITVLAPGISIVKATTTSRITATGQQVPYTFVVTNTGGVPLSNVSVADAQTPPSTAAQMGPISCPSPTLAPGISETCTATYTASQADVNNGSATDSATATGTPPIGGPVTSPPSSVTVPAQQNPSLSLVKATTTPAITAANQVVPFTFVVKNTGNVTLSSVNVTDVQTAPSTAGQMGPIVCPQPTLAPGVSETCTATYTTSQADVDNGSVTDTATAHGNPPGSTTPVDSNPSSVTIPAQPPVSLSLVKATTTTAITAAGQQVPFTFVVTNTGNSTLSSITVTDVQATPSTAGQMSAITCPNATLAPGVSETCTATYTASQADVDHGSATDTATAHGTPPGSTTPVDSNPSSVTVPAPPNPSLSLLKATTTTTIAAAGQQLPFTFLVTNTGNVTLSSINVTDVQTAPSTAGQMSAITCPNPTLAPGISETCTATYTASQADVDHGSATDTATAHGTPPGSTTPVDSNLSSVTVPAAPPAPSLSLVKATTTTTIAAAGQQLPFTFVVTNTGNVTLSGINVTDVQAAPSTAGQMSAIVCPNATLAPTVSETCTATYTASQADVDNGSATDTATAHGTPPGSTTPVDSPPSSVTVPAPPNPSLTVLKATTTTTITAAGQQLPFTFVVTNTGNVTLSSINVTDAQTAPSTAGQMSAITCPNPTLAPRASETCTATYTASQADVDHGSATDTATAHGTPPGSTTPVDSPPSSVTIPAPPNPSLTVLKATTTDKITAAGQQLPFTFLVTNTGNVTLSSINVTDAQTAPSTAGQMSAIACPNATLAPGASETCTATYTASQADVDNGSATDTATAHGTPPGSTTPVDSPPSSVTVPAPPNPSLTVLKATTTDKITAAGQQLPFTFVVTNTGNVTLSSITVTDAQTAPSTAGQMSAIVCPQPTLAPGVSETCTATYTASQADVDNGSATDTATAHGTPPGSTTPVDSPPSSVTVPAPPDPKLTIVKSASPATVSAVGATVSYSFLVTNTGNVTLTGVSVADTQQAPAGALDAAPVCPVTTLAPGASTICTATYTVTQADLNNGSVDDSATASGTPPSGPPVTSPPSTATVGVTALPSLTVVKATTTPAITAAGQQLPFTFVVTNTGNVTLSNINVTDAQTAPSTAGQMSAIDCPNPTLAPGASETCTATYTASQADVDNGSATDTATAHGTPPGSTTPVDSPPSSVTVPATQNPALSLVKSASPGTVTRLGQVVTYSFLVTNTGNVTVHDLSIADTLAKPAGTLDAAPVCPVTSLAPGAFTVCTATYHTLAADLDHGQIDNTAVANGTDPGNHPVPSNQSAAQVTVVRFAALQIVKSADPTTLHVAPGGSRHVDYTFVVTNIGNVTLSDVAVDDRLAPPAGPALRVSCPASTLAAGASMTCTAPYTATQADIDNGRIDNTATATGTTPSGTPVGSVPSSARVLIPGRPHLTLVKTADRHDISAVGQLVHYRFAVTNDGTVTLTGITIADQLGAPAGPALTVACPTTVLAPGAAMVCTAVYTVTAADIAHGGVANTATATGHPHVGPPVTSPPSSVLIHLHGQGGLSATGLPIEQILLGSALLLLGGAALTIAGTRRAARRPVKHRR